MEDRVELDLSPVRWDRAVWAEGDSEDAPLVFMLEFNAAGEVLRQIQLAGPRAEPTTAASAAEWWEAQGFVQRASTPEAIAYEQAYGTVSEGSVHDWGSDYPGQPISSAEFETAWAEARAHLAE